jgi:hypothetical protein
MPRIALIHALAHSVAPINQAFEHNWPEVTRMNLLDDSLSADLAAGGGTLDAAMQQRFRVLSDYAVSTGAQAILFTCSAFGPCIDAVAARHPQLPVLKPNEAMIVEAVAACGAADSSGDAGDAGNSGDAAGPTRPGRIGLVASFAPTLSSMPPEFPASHRPDTELADGALDALNRGDTQGHDRAVVAAAARLMRRGATVIALAQFSMARAAPAVREALGLPVLTTVDSAVAELRRRLRA